jgi:IS5 family transposase
VNLHGERSGIAKPAADGAKRVDIAVPAFGYKNHIGIDRCHRLIRTWQVTDAARYDGALLPNLLDKTNTGSRVWADTAYRSEKNEAHLARQGFKSEIHRKKPKGKRMPNHTARANAAKSKVRAGVEHVFGWQKGPMALVIRTIGMARAKAKIGLANIYTNMRRMGWLLSNAAAAA